ncbi:GNAT family N-acetyltransferase [Solibacillus sp. CAU 1738]|uniref:GNAT family N-acetyltransferase n=1 Tax=Solibacillus sp. CAU 1738 TaxID=3140363 RepID=UPI003261729A
MKVNIIQATLQDFERINELVKEGHDEHVEALPHIFKPVQQVMPLSYFQELMNDAHSEIFVAKEKEEVVGFAVLSLEQSPPFESLVQRKYAYIHDFGVKNNQQRKGIGKSLFTACVDWAKLHDAASIELNVWSFNEKAITFYENLNMQSVSRKMELKL